MTRDRLNAAFALALDALHAAVRRQEATGGGMLNKLAATRGAALRLAALCDERPDDVTLFAEATGPPAAGAPMWPRLGQ